MSHENSEAKDEQPLKYVMMCQKKKDVLMNSITT